MVCRHARAFGGLGVLAGLVITCAGLVISTVQELRSAGRNSTTSSSVQMLDLSWHKHHPSGTHLPQVLTLLAFQGLAPALQAQARSVSATKALKAGAICGAPI